MASPGHDQGCAGYDLTHLHAVMLTLYGRDYWAMLSEWPLCEQPIHVLDHVNQAEP